MMKRILVASGVLLLLAFFLFPSSQAFAAPHLTNIPFGNFGASCRSESITLNPVVLHATCKANNGQPHGTTLALDDGIGNDNGSLVFGDQNFTRTCNGIFGHMSSGHLILVAGCLTRSQKRIPTSIDLNGGISNINGNLEFD